MSEFTTSIGGLIPPGDSFEVATFQPGGTRSPLAASIFSRLRFLYFTLFSALHQADIDRN